MLGKIQAALPAPEEGENEPGGGGLERTSTTGLRKGHDGLAIGALPFVCRLLGGERDKNRQGRALHKSVEVALAALDLLWAAICSTVDRHPDKCQELLDVMTDVMEKPNAKAKASIRTACIEFDHTACIPALRTN